MKNDYLWDGTGEPDPDVQQLENLLSEFRGTRPAPEMPVTAARPRRVLWPGIAAAAALLAIGLTTVVWVSVLRQGTPEDVVEVSVTPPPTTASEPPPHAPSSNPTVTGEEPKSTRGAPDTFRPVGRGSNGGAPGKQHIRNSPPAATGAQPGPGVTVPTRAPAQRRPNLTTVLDIETARHLEQTEMLLRSFRNARPVEGQLTVDVSFDKLQSRELLYRNITLRRNAEARGNLPAENLLGSLEPYLIDIANVKAVSSREEIRPIQDSLRKREVVAELQLYSANRSTPGF
jgi:hypothetical protein